MKKYNCPKISTYSPVPGLPTCLAIAAASAVASAAAVAASKLVSDDRFSHKNASLQKVKE